MRDLRPSEVRQERMDSLMSVPSHRPAAVKFNAETMSRSMAPLTQEDKEQSGNLPLINTLRQPNLSPYKSLSNAGPPAFYDDDIRKKESRFARSI